VVRGVTTVATMGAAMAASVALRPLIMAAGAGYLGYQALTQTRRRRHLE